MFRNPSACRRKPAQIHETVPREGRMGDRTPSCSKRSRPGFLSLDFQMGFTFKKRRVQVKGRCRETWKTRTGSRIQSLKGVEVTLTETFHSAIETILNDQTAAGLRQPSWTLLRTRRIRGRDEHRVTNRALWVCRRQAQHLSASRSRPGKQQARVRFTDRGSSPRSARPICNFARYVINIKAKGRMAGWHARLEHGGGRSHRDAGFGLFKSSACSPTQPELDPQFFPYQHCSEK